MAPELWRGHPADARSDLYALGATLYHLLAGEEPFGDLPDLAATARAHFETEPAPFAARGLDVSGALEAVVLRCLCKRPEDRPGSAAELLDALEGCAIAPWTSDDARQAWKEAALDDALWGAEVSSDMERTIPL
jgi:serine/threonine-protein kinase